MRAKPDWLPDWWDASAYIPLKRAAERIKAKKGVIKGGHAEIAYLRWQFLRRNPTYQRDWARHHPDSYKRAMSVYKGQPLPDGVESWESHFGVVAEMPGCELRYGIRCLTNPASESPAPALFVPRYGGVANLCSAEHFEKLSSQGIRLFAFNLNEPLEDQLSRVKHMFKEVRSLEGARTTNRHYGKWPDYIRILDAETEMGELSGDAVAKVAEVIFPENDNKYPDTPASKKLRKALRAAINIRDNPPAGNF